MDIVNTYEAKTHLSQLLDRAAAGEDIVIGKAGKPIARLVAFHADPAATRTGGRWRGQVKISDDFDAPLDAEIQDAFQGRGA